MVVLGPAVPDLHLAYSAGGLDQTPSTVGREGDDALADIGGGQHLQQGAVDGRAMAGQVAGLRVAPQATGF